MIKTSKFKKIIAFLMLMILFITNVVEDMQEDNMPHI